MILLVGEQKQTSVSVPATMDQVGAQCGKRCVYPRPENAQRDHR